MKKDKIIEKIKFHHESKEYTKITRKISKHNFQSNHGYVLNFSDDLVLLQETDEFDFNGYCIFPIKLIDHIRFNKWDKYYGKIMEWENQLGKLGINYSVSIKNWKSAFKSLKEKGLNIIVECEGSDHDRFLIGPIIEINKNGVTIHNYDPAGFFDKEPTSIDYEMITKVMFDDRYNKIFGKYTRHRKNK